MKLLSFTICFLLFCGCKSKNIEKYDEKTTFYVGTYTKNDSKSEGIYKYSISKEGKLFKIGLAAKTENPSYLAKSFDGKTLLAVGEINRNENGFLKSYAIKKDSLVFKSESKSGGANPCYININENNNVLVANYSGGNVGLLKLNSDQKLTELLYVQQHLGKGTTKRQQLAHAHSVYFHPVTNDIISVDLGTNQLWFSQINGDEKQILSQPNTLNMEVGAGPRHLDFHPNKKWMYVLNELNNTVSVVKFIDKNYKIVQSISTLPKEFTDFSTSADIHISKDGNFLYTSNRGHDSITIFEVNKENGELKWVGFQSVLGKTPRNFSLTPDNTFLVVANQDSDNLVSFKRNSKTGMLAFVSEVYAPTPVCVLF